MTNYSINLAEIGQRIKILRIKQRKTQEYFADMLYISPSYLALIENGKRTPTIDILSQIAKVCDVSVDYLLYGEPSQNYNKFQQHLQRLMDEYPPEKIEKALTLAECYLTLDATDGTDP